MAAHEGLLFCFAEADGLRRDVWDLRAAKSSRARAPL
jgi:hypothetical protein